MRLTIASYSRILPFCNLGRMGYADALRLQEDLVKRQLLFTENSPNPDVLLLVEHTPVYTVGLRSNEFTQVDEAALRRQGAEFHHTNRGGLITFHGPGQLVAYPIINLQRYRPSIRWYVQQLEEVLIKTCAAFGVKCGRTEHTGIWVERETKDSAAKIAAIGLNCKKYVTSHGVALNCNTDLTWFDQIVPCGLTGMGVTSLTVCRGVDTPISQVVPVFLQKFKEIFEIDGMPEATLDSLKFQKLTDRQTNK